LDATPEERQKSQIKSPRGLLILLAILVFFGYILSHIDNPETSKQVRTSATGTTSIAIDIPSLLGRDAQQVRKMMEAKHGKPDILRQPFKDKQGEAFGTMSWRVGGYMFGFNFYGNGDIGTNRDGTFVLNGFAEKGHTREGVIRAGNLKRSHPDYLLRIDSFGGNTEVLITPKRKLKRSGADSAERGRQLNR